MIDLLVVRVHSHTLFGVCNDLTPIPPAPPEAIFFFFMHRFSPSRGRKCCGQAVELDVVVGEAGRQRGGVYPFPATATTTTEKKIGRLFAAVSLEGSTVVVAVVVSEHNVTTRVRLCALGLPSVGRLTTGSVRSDDGTAAVS